MQTQRNNMELCPKFIEFDRLCPIKLMLVSQIIPRMSIVAKMKGAQHGSKGQCFGANRLENLSNHFIKTCDEEYIVSLALKRELVDKLNDITTNNYWEDLSEQSYLVLWKLLTDKNNRDSNNSDQTDIDDDIEDNDKFKERELKEYSSS